MFGQQVQMHQRIPGLDYLLFCLVVSLCAHLQELYLVPMIRIVWLLIFCGLTNSTSHRHKKLFSIENILMLI